MTTIGYATLQIVPSLRGVSAEINKQLAAERDMGTTAGKQLGANMSAGIVGGLTTAGKDGTKALDKGIAGGIAKAAPGWRQSIADGLLSGMAQNGDKAANTFRGRFLTGVVQGLESGMRDTGTKGGKALSDGFGEGIKGISGSLEKLALKGALVGAAGVAAAALGGVGLALTKGFQRLESIDQATFKLKALGHSAGETKAIMDDALASVKGTAFGLDEAVTAAASAVAAGIKPGQDLTKYLTEVGDAAAVAGTSFGDMGHIFDQIQTQNKAYTNNLQELSDRGVPIFTWLQQEYGVTGAALTKMVQNGQVDAAHFQDAIEKHIGGAALTMGQSFAGSVQNAQAALARLGAAFLAPIFGNAAGGIGSVTDGLDNMTKWVTAHQPEIVGFFTTMGVAAVSMAQDMVKSFGQMAKGAGDFAHGLGTVVSLFDTAKGQELQNVGDTLNGIGDKIISTAQGFDAAKDKIRAWGDATRQAAENAQGAYGPVTGLGTALGALPFKKVIGVEVQTGDSDSKIHGIGNAIDALPFKKTVELEIHGTATGTAYPAPLLNDPNHPLIGPQNDGPLLTPNNNGIPTLHKALGGPVFGAGSATSDSIPALLSNGEHVWPTDEVNMAGGQGAMYRLRGLVASGALRGFATGGMISGGGIASALLPYDPSVINGGGGNTRQRRILWWGGKDGLPPRTSTPNDPLVPWGPNAKGKMIPPNIFGGLPGEENPRNDFPRHGDSRDIWWQKRRDVGMLGFSGGGVVGQATWPDPMIGRGTTAYNPDHPTGGGNFNPDMKIDISRASVALPGDRNRLLFGDILKSIPGAYGPKDNDQYHARRRYNLDAVKGDSIWGLGFAGGGGIASTSGTGTAGTNNFWDQLLGGTKSAAGQIGTAFSWLDTLGGRTGQAFTDPIAGTTTQPQQLGVGGVKSVLAKLAADAADSAAPKVSLSRSPAYTRSNIPINPEHYYRGVKAGSLDELFDANGIMRGYGRGGTENLSFQTGFPNDLYINSLTKSNMLIEGASSMGITPAAGRSGYAYVQELHKQLVESGETPLRVWMRKALPGQKIEDVHDWELIFDSFTKSPGYGVPPGHASGGAIFGAGSATSDSIPALLSTGEHVWTANEVNKVGGQSAMYAMRAAVRGFAGGGAVAPDVTAAENLVGTPYSIGKRFDCSGDVARVINAALGLPGGDLMTTASASKWLAARGFKPGLGGPGAISVGWKNGGPGGGHMAMTLSDGRSAEGGGSHPNFLVGAGAAGASSAQFTNHMFLALAAAAIANGAGQDTTGQGANTTAPAAGSSSGGGAGPLPASISGLSSFGLTGLGSGVGTTGSGSDLSLFGNAAGAAVSGQVSSLAGVFGVGDTPPFLKAASMLVGGLKVGGHGHPGQSDGSIFNGANPLGSFGQGGSSAAPLSATATATGTPPPDNAGNMHGTRAGQQPGPAGPTYNIRTATVEDAFLQAQRLQKERMAAKIGHI